MLDKPDAPDISQTEQAYRLLEERIVVQLERRGLRFGDLF